MLKSLSVENYALIDRLEMDLSESLNIITGETGAGKSILLGALGLLLGAKADAGVVRDVARNCVVEGVFSVEGYGLEGFFEENELDYEPVVVVRRVVASTGKSRAYVNDLPVQQNVLKELSVRLLDIHSQHQALMLAEDGFRMAIVDGAAGGVGLGEYRTVYDRLRVAERQLADLQEIVVRSEQEREWLEHQVAQFVEARLRDGEQEELEVEQSVLGHSEEIKTVLSANVARLDGENFSILAELKSAVQGLNGITAFYSRAGEFAARLDSTLIELRDVERELAADAERIESDPRRLEEVNDRLNLIYSLQQKHKIGSVAQLLDIQRDCELKLAAITGSGEAVEALEKEISDLRRHAVELAAAITKMRCRAAGEVSEHVEKMAAALGIPAAKFVVEIVPAALKPSGADDIKFLFSANKNVVPAPVEKIASGGETSRIMLALKALVARNRSLPTIIFDEIDTGVSGSVADAMGRIIESLAGSMQVINITHLPQVASKGEAHFVVYKDGESCTRIRRLTVDERVEHIAQMLSGQAVTDAARQQARLLLGVD